MEYEFTFVVAGVTVDEDGAVFRLESKLDAMLARAGGQDLLTIAFEGCHPVGAAIAAARAARRCVPALRISRLDRDLVSIPMIAERTGKSQRTVQRWVNGKHLSPPFPRPEGAQAWLWAEVNTWLRPRGLSDGCFYPLRGDMMEIDFFLAGGK